jgi:hypothetical protein
MRYSWKRGRANSGVSVRTTIDRTPGAGKSAGPVPPGDVIVTVGRGGVVSTVIWRRSVTVRPSLRRPIRTR